MEDCWEQEPQQRETAGAGGREEEKQRDGKKERGPGLEQEEERSG